MKSRILLATICVIDGVVTYFLWAWGLIKEENPLMLFLLQNSTLGFFLVKGVQTFAVIILGYLIWNYTPKMKVVYWVVIVMYLGVFVRAVIGV